VPTAASRSVVGRPWGRLPTATTRSPLTRLVCTPGATASTARPGAMAGGRRAERSPMRIIRQPATASRAAVASMSQCPRPGTTSVSKAPATAATMPTGVLANTAAPSTSPSRA
jgi:hypothetical protein